jgi:hypothetical protein
MKFDSLFKTVFLGEQDELPVNQNDVSSSEDEAPIELPETEPAGDGVPVPDNYDVEPVPVQQPMGDAGSIKNYIMKLDGFADELNSTDTSSLQQIITDIDRPGSLFQGISREVSGDIIKLAKQVRDVSEILKGFIINSAKRQRDIAAGQG